MNIDHCFFEKSNEFKKEVLPNGRTSFFLPPAFLGVKKNKKIAKNRERRYTSKTLILERSLKKS
jgi:hypothetical protein